MMKSIAVLVLVFLLMCGSALAEDGLRASIQQTAESPEWVKALPAAQDENVKQLFIVAGFGMDSTAAFGIAEDPGCQMPYLQADDDIYWSGDFDRSYNQMVRLSEVPELNMKNSEHIVEYECQYQYSLNGSF